MKKLAPYFATREKVFWLFFSLFFPALGFSLFVDNPSSPSILEEGIFSKDAPVNLRVGYHTSIVGDERLRVYKSEEEKFVSLRAPARMQVFSLILNVKERADLSLFSGSDLVFLRLQMKNHVYDLKSRESFFVAGGGKILLIENKEFSFGVDGKYLFFRTHVSTFYKDAAPLPFFGSLMQLKEWQITPLISYKTGFLIPYFGIPCRFAKMHVKHLPFVESALLQLKSLHKAGICLGVTISPCLGTFVNLEGEWLSENSFNLSSEVRF